MYLIIVIGHTGQGKTTWVNKFITGKKQYVFDVNNEYVNLPDDKVILPQMRNRNMDLKHFLNVTKSLNNYNIVFEDATGFFRGKQSPVLMKEIVRKRHTGNNFIILFHSINRVPPELMEMSNYIILFKTNDNFEIIDKKFRNEQITNAFLKLSKMKQFSFIEIKTI